MNFKVDLHTHTTASDGSKTPSELVQIAADSGIKVIAITDHDTLDGVNEAIQAGKRLGVEVVAGVEIGVEFNPEMHILGYFFNDGYLKLQPILEQLKESREKRNPKIIKKLNEMGFDITLEEAINESGGGIVGRPHIAKVMVNKGYVKSVSEAFEIYLSSGRPAYFKKDRLTPYQGIQEIKKAGGIPVLAHPIFLERTFSQLDDLLLRMKLDGLVGVEVYHTEHSQGFARQLEILAQKHGLIMTGGSDYHGDFKPDIDLGIGRGNLSIDYALYENLKNSNICK